MPGFRGTSKGSTTERGYGGNWPKLRARWAKVVDRGEGFCQQGIPGNGSSGTCLHRTRWIKPGSDWHLGHSDNRLTVIGPVHADCNRHDGAVRGGRAALRARRSTQPRTRTRWQSRTW